MVRCRTRICWASSEIEAGPFTMGSDRDGRARKVDEQPQHIVDLPEFYVARYPVTVAQFRAFVERRTIPTGRPGLPPRCA